MNYDLEAEKFTMGGRNGVKAYVKSVYDGDTMKCIFGLPDICDGRQFMWNCRLTGVDTPEIRGSGPREKQWAYRARDFVRDLVWKKEVFLDIEGEDKYGRLLVNAYVKDESDAETMLNLSMELISGNWAVPYLGSGDKARWEEMPFPWEDESLSSG